MEQRTVISDKSNHVTLILRTVYDDPSTNDALKNHVWLQVQQFGRHIRWTNIQCRFRDIHLNLDSFRVSQDGTYRPENMKQMVILWDWNPVTLPFNVLTQTFA